MKRRWFQIHLSTAVLLMFVAGGMLWLNVGGTEKYIYYEFLESEEALVSNSVVIGKTFGWPREISIVETIEHRTVAIKEIPEEATFYSPDEYVLRKSGIRPASLIVNVMIALCFSAIVIFSSEYFIRRREARTP